MPNDPACARRRGVRAVALGLVAALGACARPAFEPPQLTVAMSGDDARVAVRGAPGLDVFLVANRPWRGEHELYPGLIGMRASAQVLPADRAAGAGVLLAGRLQAADTEATLDAARLRALPLPIVLQVVALGEAAGGGRAMVLSNAVVLARDGDGPDAPLGAAPWRVGGALAGEWRRLAALAAVPLALLWLLRWGRRAVAAQWLLAAGIAAALGARALAPASIGAEAGTAAPPLLTWPPPRGEVDALERACGDGVQATLAAIAQHRRPGEPVTFVLGSQQRTGREVVAVQLAARTAEASVVALPAAARAPGLAFALDPVPGVLAETNTAIALGDAPEPAPGPTADAAPRTQVATTPLGTLWRIEAPR